ncbi:MAG: signal peptidase I [Candidatus Pacebacteria bacterium]|nr:signal peptidase I [Candidatus Paceibacterota bacterium]
MQTEKANDRSHGMTYHIWEVIKFFFLALIIVAPIRFFIAQPFIVHGASMDPTFATGQYLIIDEISYRFEEPKRGDVVVLRYPKEPNKFFIKRIIGLPGETLTIKNGNVTITDKNTEIPFAIEEPYVIHTKTDHSDDEIIELSNTESNREYYVMGDNRAASLDSRSWGTLPERLIVGKALIRLFPFDKIDIFPGQNFAVE